VPRESSEAEVLPLFDPNCAEAKRLYPCVWVM
jgi:hypothetical protein